MVTFQHLLYGIDGLIQSVRLINAVIFPIYILYLNSIKNENERINESMEEIKKALEPTNGDIIDVNVSIEYPSV